MDVEEFRALARSSPWSWRSVGLTWQAFGHTGGEVRAWIRRPGRMRVEEVGRPARLVDESRDAGGGRAWLTALSGGASPGVSPDEPPWEPPPFRVPQDPVAPQPTWRDDGLVARRPDDFSIAYDDPMYQNYQWVAMLDPVELADGMDDDGRVADPPVEVLELAGTERLGRHTLDAVVRPRDVYDPRCACCPLLYSAITDRYEGIAAGVIARKRYAEAYRVQLDRATGICVTMRELGGDNDGSGFEVTIHEVDVNYPDALFI